MIFPFQKGALDEELVELQTGKTGIRVLGIAESFKRTSACSTLAGIVMHRDPIIDGMFFVNVTIEGNDSTQNFLSMYRSLKRDDINCIMLDGPEYHLLFLSPSSIGS